MPLYLITTEHGERIERAIKIELWGNENMDEKMREARNVAWANCPINDKDSLKNDARAVGFNWGFDAGVAAAQSSGPGPRQALGGDVFERAGRFWQARVFESETPAETMAAFAQSETTVLRQALGNLVTAINQAPAVQWANVEGIEAMKAAQNLLGETK